MGKNKKKEIDKIDNFYRCFETPTKLDNEAKENLRVAKMGVEHTKVYNRYASWLENFPEKGNITFTKYPRIDPRPEIRRIIKKSYNNSLKNFMSKEEFCKETGYKWKDL